MKLFEDLVSKYFCIKYSVFYTTNSPSASRFLQCGLKSLTCRNLGFRVYGPYFVIILPTSFQNCIIQRHIPFIFLSFFFFFLQTKILCSTWFSNSSNFPKLDSLIPIFARFIEWISADSAFHWLSLNFLCLFPTNRLGWISSLIVDDLQWLRILAFQINISDTV